MTDDNPIHTFILILTAFLVGIGIGFAIGRFGGQPVERSILLRDCVITAQSVPVFFEHQVLADVVYEETGSYQLYPIMNDIIFCESSWMATAQNPKSTAYGYCQMIDSTKEMIENNIGEIDWDDKESQLTACVWLLDNYGTDPWLASYNCWK